MYTYGPVPSRRLGSSLGVSPIPPKTCSYSCVYCQLGRTNHLQIKRKRFFPREAIFNEISVRVKRSNPDYITFVGDGEPTLCEDLGWLIKQCKYRWSTPIAVITNGSLLFMDDVRQDLMGADVVLPTLDAGNSRTFAKINRHHGKIDYQTMLEGQILFRKGYTGKIWVEVMLVESLNDSEQELKEIKSAVDKINPDRVYVSIPIRPPAESWVKPPSPETILKAQHILGSAISIAVLESGDFGLEGFVNAEQAITEIGSRHPLRYKQALKIAEIFSTPRVVGQMVGRGKVVEVEYGGEKYLLPEHFVRK